MSARLLVLAALLAASCAAGQGTRVLPELGLVAEARGRSSRRVAPQAMRSDAGRDTRVGLELRWSTEEVAGNPVESGEGAHLESVAGSSSLRGASSARWIDLPAVRQLVEAAWRVAELDPGRARALASDARRAGWAPTISVGVRRGTGRDVDESVGGNAYTYSADDDLALEARVSFRLDRVVFAPESVPLLREERTIALARGELAKLVLDLYFERLRLLSVGVQGPEARIRVAEIEVFLDVLTGGAFTLPRPAAEPIEGSPGP